MDDDQPHLLQPRCKQRRIPRRCEDDLHSFLFDDSEQFLDIAKREGLDVSEKRAASPAPSGASDAIQRCILLGFSDHVARRLDAGRRFRAEGLFHLVAVALGIRQADGDHQRLDRGNERRADQLQDLVRAVQRGDLPAERLGHLLVVGLLPEEEPAAADHGAQLRRRWLGA